MLQKEQNSYITKGGEIQIKKPINTTKKEEKERECSNLLQYTSTISPLSMVTIYQNQNKKIYEKNIWYKIG